MTLLQLEPIPPQVFGADSLEEKVTECGNQVIPNPLGCERSVGFTAIGGDVAVEPHLRCLLDREIRQASRLTTFQLLQLAARLLVICPETAPDNPTALHAAEVP